MEQPETPFTLVHKAPAPRGAPPFLLIHGSWGSSMMWMAYAEVFAKHGFDVYAPDLRGHGKSGGSVAGASMDDFVADVAAAARANGLENPVVIGHSMGGLVALMYAARHGAAATVAIDPSPSKEVQGGEEKTYAPEYSPMDAGMPGDPKAVMEAFPDIPQEMLMKLKQMLGKESGLARAERKRGISIPKDALSMPTLFVGGELGESVPFGIGIRTARAMAQYYGKPVIEIKGATHPGILVGMHAAAAAGEIEAWLEQAL